MKLFCCVDALGEERAREQRLAGAIFLPGRSNHTLDPKTRGSCSDGPGHGVLRDTEVPLLKEFFIYAMGRT